MSSSTSNFILGEGDGVTVYVEHGDFGSEATTFIRGIANDAWVGDVDDEDPEYHKKMNPTYRYWKKHDRPMPPSLKLGKRKFGFIPPASACFLGPEARYEMRKGGCGEYEKLVKHKACQCSRCLNYHWEHVATHKFWHQFTGPIKVNV